MKNLQSVSVIGLGLILITFFLLQNAYSQIVPVGNGSYTTVFPGVDPAGRNSYPSGTPYTSGVAATKPVPTNDWWSAKVKEPHVNNIFNYPTALRTINQGLVVSYIEAPSGPNGSSQPMDDMLPIVVGVEGLNATSATVSDFSDWMVTMNWANGAHSFSASVGLGMPFIYFNKNSADVASISITEGTVTIYDEMIVVASSHYGQNYAIYAPVGSTWSQSGTNFTSNLNNKNYWSIAYLPPEGGSLLDKANQYKNHAYVFPINTLTSWEYDENTSVVRTEFSVETEIMEGTGATVLLGLLPHQWSHLAPDSPAPNGYEYASIRGTIEVLESNEFYVEDVFHGILPTLPNLVQYSPWYSPTELQEKIQLIENDGLATWTDSYNEGQVMNRLIQTARIADLTGNTVGRDKIIETIKERLEDWLTAEEDEVAFIYYYNDDWTALIGYPAGHGQDYNLNDHHFHWGYFIHAAAFLEQFQPGWAEGWGEMIDHLVRDAASTDRDDPLFPFLRNFSPYAGHSWANGFATFPFGNDQESSSESMQFASSLIHWGTLTSNNEIRDLGIYLYTTEHTAIEEYWFDENNRTFKPEYDFRLVSRIWGNGYDNKTFWTSDIAAAYGIELYPIHGGSLYLGQNHDYIQELWTEMTENTGILQNQPNDNLWHDIYWQYLAFLDPQWAIDLYDSYPDRNLKFGVSDAQTYYWLHSMNAVGKVNPEITANYPIAACFIDEGEKVYAAHNYSTEAITVDFSDGYQLDVPARSMATSRDISISGSLSSSFTHAFANGSVELAVTVSGGQATKIEFYDGETFLGEVAEEPYNFTASNLFAGKHNFYAKIFDNEAYAISNAVTVIAGQQLPYTGSVFSIPGTIEAGLYDKFEGGVAQDIAYIDVSVNNEGGFRPEEYVDALEVANEGATVGWIAAGEWLEFSIDVDQPGYYTFDFRHASDNANGGGPFHLELDGNPITDPIFTNNTGGWNTWQTKSYGQVAFSQGDHILRVVFGSGEFNLGEMNFTYDAPLDYNQPVSNAGENVAVILPATTAMLDGTGSYDPGSEILTYLWTQVYGPSVVEFSNDEIADPEISLLSEGVYLFELYVENESEYNDTDQVYVTVNDGGGMAPNVTINYPENNSEFNVGEEFTIVAQASDLDGYVTQVEFFENDMLVGTVTAEPWQLGWSFSSLGNYTLSAKATDNDGNVSLSQLVNVAVVPAPPCYGTSYNGEYDWEFSPDQENPTLTFIPSQPGVGSPTCILYYSTSPNPPFPGYPVTPNQPYQITASQGSIVYFYYTYSWPGGGEHNTSANPDQFEVGNCDPTVSVQNVKASPSIQVWPNPVKHMVKFQFPEIPVELILFDIHGNKLATIVPDETSLEYDMSRFEPGLYVVRVFSQNRYQHLKFLKQ